MVNFYQITRWQLPVNNKPILYVLNIHVNVILQPVSEASKQTFCSCFTSHPHSVFSSTYTSHCPLS